MSGTIQAPSSGAVFVAPVRGRLFEKGLKRRQFVADRLKQSFVGLEKRVVLWHICQYNLLLLPHECHHLRTINQP